MIVYLLSILISKYTIQIEKYDNIKNIKIEQIDPPHP